MRQISVVRPEKRLDRNGDVATVSVQCAVCTEMSV